MITDTEKLEKEPCRCVRCAECGGSGNVWISMDGKYVGKHRSDDLDDMEPCDECGGSGITETCERCQLLRDADHDADDRNVG